MDARTLYITGLGGSHHRLAATYSMINQPWGPPFQIQVMKTRKSIFKNIKWEAVLERQSLCKVGRTA